jgi:hypothetical protein
MTQRSQRMPLTWIVSVTTATALRYRPLDEICADSSQTFGTTDLQLAVGLTRVGIEAVQRNRQLARERRDCKRFVAIGMDELAVRPEARSGPTVLLVDATLTGVEGPRW